MNKYGTEKRELGECSYRDTCETRRKCDKGFIPGNEYDKRDATMCQSYAPIISGLEMQAGEEI
ncbi:MAG: hypothetical protein AABX28_00420 [Nanoarchaeota archaeon]